MSASSTATAGGVFDATRDINFTGQCDFSTVQTSTASGKIGFATGSGGVVTQATNKSTGVTLNTTCGQITTSNASLATDTVVSFTMTNSTIAAGDVLILNHLSGGTVGSYVLNAQSAGGSALISITNFTGGTLSEALVIAFAVIKAVKA